MTNRFGDIDTTFKRLPPIYGFRGAKTVTLEEALEPIEPEIDELRYYIRVAKNHCHYPSEHGLTKDQSAAIYIYTMEWGDTTLYRVLNKALRSENRQALRIWFPYLKLFDTGLDRLPTVREILWRGVSLDIGKDFTQNQVFTWWSINSCSIAVNIIKNFLENKKDITLFLIEAINGKKISGYTEFENEDEVILRIGTRFRVKADVLAQPNGSHVVHLIEIDNTADDQRIATGGSEVPQMITSPNTGASSMSSDVEKKSTPTLSSEKVDDKKNLESIISKIIDTLELNTSDKKDEILKTLFEHGQQSLKDYKDYLIPAVYQTAMNENDNQLIQLLKNYFEQQWRIEYNSNPWFIQFLNESKSEGNRHLYEQVLLRTAKCGNKFMKNCPILSISLQLLFEGIDDKCLEKTDLFNQLWLTITIDGLKSIPKYSDYIFKDVMKEQIQNKQSILFRALREYYRPVLFQFLEECNIQDRQNLYEITLDHVAELGWKNGIQAIENEVIPVSFRTLLKNVNLYLKQQKGKFDDKMI